MVSRLILDGAPLIAIHKARYYKRKDGLALGPGPFVTGLEYATDSKATVVGKPERTFFLEALRGTGCTPEETVMIGDVSIKTGQVPDSFIPFSTACMCLSDTNRLTFPIPWEVDWREPIHKHLSSDPVSIYLMLCLQRP